MANNTKPSNNRSKPDPDTQERRTGNGRGKPNSRARGRKPNQQGSTRTNGYGSSASKRNELSWYNQNPLLTRAAANVPFPYRAGMAYPNPLGSAYAGTKQPYGNFRDFDSVPGLMAIEWIPSAGHSTTVTSPISMTARDLYSKIRSAFSGSLQVDAPDLIIHLLAMDSIYSYIEFLKRIFKIVNTFTPHNLLTPELMLRAMGFQTQEIEQLKADKVRLFSIINELCLMTNKFSVPDVMPLFARHTWMNSRIYSDANTLNSQLYMFYQRRYLMFHTDSNGAGGLQTAKLDEGWDTSDVIDSLFKFGDKLLRALSDWDDAYIINGYLQRAFGDGPMIKLEPLTDMNATVEIVYDEVVLSQIENLSVAPTYAQGVSGAVETTITQDPTSNVVKAVTSIVASKDAGLFYSDLKEITINSRYDTPADGDVIEATRLKSHWRSVGSSTMDAVADVCGTEVVVNINLVHYIYSASGEQMVEFIPLSNLILGLTSVTEGAGTVSITFLQSFLRALSLLSAFDWHPIIAIGATYSNGEALVADTYTCGDVHNITVISREQLKQINKVCLYSEFNSFSI